MKIAQRGKNFFDIPTIIAIAILSNYMFFMHNVLTSRTYFLLEIISILILLKSCYWRIKINIYLINVITLELIICIFTITNQRITYSFLCLTLAEIILTIYLTTSLNKNPQKTVFLFSSSLTLMYILDIISVIFCIITKKYSNSEFGLVGHKNYHSFLFIITIGFYMLNLKINYNKIFNIKLIIMCVISVVCEAVLKSASGLVSITLFIFLCFFMSQKKILFLNLYTVVTGLLVIDYIIIFALAHNKWLIFILNSLGRGSGFTGRTLMWELSLELIKEQPWLGYGYLKEVSYYSAQVGEVVKNHCHNFFLNLVLSGGIIYFLLFLVFLIMVAAKIKRMTTVESNIILYMISCYLLLGISEVIVNVNSFLFPLLTLGFYASTLSISKQRSAN